jgi:hypothetical protein
MQRRHLAAARGRRDRRQRCQTRNRAVLAPLPVIGGPFGATAEATGATSQSLA